MLCLTQFDIVLPGGNDTLAYHWLLKVIRVGHHWWAETSFMWMAPDIKVPLPSIWTLLMWRSLTVLIKNNLSRIKIVNRKSKRDLKMKKRGRQYTTRQPWVCHPTSTSIKLSLPYLSVYKKIVQTSLVGVFINSF